MTDTKEIPLTNSDVFAIVDAADYEWLSAWHLQLSPQGYAYRCTMAGGKRKTVLLHVFILNPLPGLEVDHRNTIRLDNRRENLRICTVLENRRNRSKIAGTTSIYKGVYWHSGGKKWCARIKTNDRTTHIGLFVSEVEAAHAYDLAAAKHHGAFAYPNFPTEAAYLAALAQEQGR